MEYKRMALMLLLLWMACNDRSPLGTAMVATMKDSVVSQPKPNVVGAPIATDSLAYNQKWQQLVHGRPSSKWPPKTCYPLPGAVLPFRRVVAFYGNFYSSGMGILGQLTPDELLERLRIVAGNWESADSLTPVQPAIHYIAVTAQRSPGKDGKYRLRMPFSQVDKAVDLAGE
ncbi:hypothetical protein MKQ70_20085 [Chitinophaga sedimenti]|uniref:hypothetical protein n=1 Tax=Chitinophaga sedimenti TaxID=2033606 RepID=UPI00200300FF|nr:hypothetical protein [Chitinophaga sedimenti]MCK7557178.1 hypothetical protein [Chitinophaga sedimenti]